MNISSTVFFDCLNDFAGGNLLAIVDDPVVFRNSVFLPLRLLRLGDRQEQGGVGKGIEDLGFVADVLRGPKPDDFQ